MIRRGRSRRRVGHRAMNGVVGEMRRGMRVGVGHGGVPHAPGRSYRKLHAVRVVERSSVDRVHPRKNLPFAKQMRLSRLLSAVGRRTASDHPAREGGHAGVVDALENRVKGLLHLLERLGHGLVFPGERHPKKLSSFFGLTGEVRQTYLVDFLPRFDSSKMHSWLVDLHRCLIKCSGSQHCVQVS